MILSNFKMYKFDCNTHCAPAYTCNIPNDNSGEYYKKEDVDEFIKKLLDGKFKQVSMSVKHEKGK